ncbi:MAG: diguanylate cyclase [Pseudomonadota bacterium]
MHPIQPPAPPRELPASAHRAKVLIVDDVAANRALIRHTLPPGEVEAVEASSGEQALAICRDEEFALILLDVRMPGMDGFELAAALSRDAHTRETPIIFVTAADGGDMARLKSYQFGAVDYITKPVDEQVLTSKLRVFVELWRSKRQLHQLLGVLEERNKKLEQEITERQRIETLVRHQAQHDALTSLPNRILFLDRLDTALERATRHHENFALLYIDIDGFKPVNDTHGHQVGDELLRHIAQRLAKAVRKTDTVARMGGDEFAVILEEVGTGHAALQVGLKLCESLAQPYDLDMLDGLVQVRIGASIGVALFPDHGRARNDLINVADAAMYRAKRSGKSRAVLADPQGGSNLLTHERLATRY